MAKVTVSEAARLVGLARQNLYKNYINEGKISIERDHLGKPKIDTSELIRVFGEIRMTSGMSQEEHKMTTENTIHDGELTAITQAKDQVIAALQLQIEAAIERERKAEDREAWLRQQLEDAQRQVKLLTHDGGGDSSAKRAPWWRLWK
jgi:ATP-dependent Lon protease